MKRCIVNVSTGSPYTDYQKRLKASIEAVMPGMHLMFWTDELPKGSRPYEESMYGFKMYAFQEAFKAYDSVIWLDSPTVLHRSIYPLFDILEGRGELVVATEAKLYQYVNEKTINHYRVTREHIKEKDWKLNYGFIFGFTRGYHTYEKMFAGERAGLFGGHMECYRDHVANNGKLFNGEYVSHRHEESVLSLLVQMEGRTMIPLTDINTNDHYLSFEKTPL